MKRSTKLRSQMFTLMALLVFLQSAALVFALVVSRVFLMLDAEAFRLFENTTNARAQACNTSIGRLVSQMAADTQALSDTVQALAAQAGIDEAAIYLDDAAYQAVAQEGAGTLISLLQTSDISGAFLVLNGSNANKADADAHSAIYLRNSATNSAARTDNFLLEVGPISVSQQNKIPASINWRLDIRRTEEGLAYFDRVLEAVQTFPKAEIERYGYWATPRDVLGDGHQVVTYTMPLLSRDGTAYGVLGIEISITLFTQHYLPATDLPYQNSFYSISCAGDDAISLSWYIPNSPLGQVYLRQQNALAIKAAPAADIYETQVQGLGPMYCAIEPLVMYSQNSPFHGESWSLVGYVPQEALRETSQGIRNTLVASIGITTILAFASIFVLVYITTRKISGLSKQVAELSPDDEIRFTRTGIREIDDLMNAVEKLNQSVKNAAKTTSKILELTLMPLGGFEVSADSRYVVLTEYIYRLLNIPAGTEITKDAWQTLWNRLVESPAQGYENIYHFTDHAGEEKWLRILEAPTETGRVGIVLDVSKDIEEHRRLAHELDYDALTHLYSRTAFKREAFRLIKDAPDRIGGMVFIDLDNLKYMNDTYGHDLGDRLIIRAGEMFRAFEQVGGVVSRISGDEFAIYLHGYDDVEEIRVIIKDLFEKNVEYTFRTPDGQAQRIRFSAGVAYYPKDSQDVTDLLKLSDYAMYEAKHNQKGTLFEFNRESYSENIYLLENREAINLLLDEGLIRFAFQPIVDLKTGEVFAYEALMRPLLENFKSPLEILSVAAAQSKLVQLERLVWLTAFQALRDRQREMTGRMLFINSIPSQTLPGEDLLALERSYSDLFRQVVIEVTEAENDSPTQLERKLAFIRKHGMKVAIDDYGSGYSNEIRMLSLTPDILKVDIEMIRGIDQDQDKQQLLQNLVSFCRPRGIKLVGEGVERREELAAISRLGVDFVQGFYTGRPSFEIMPIDAEIKKEIQDLQGESL